MKAISNQILLDSIDWFFVNAEKSSYLFIYLLWNSLNNDQNQAACRKLEDGLLVCQISRLFVVLIDLLGSNGER